MTSSNIHPTHPSRGTPTESVRKGVQAFWHGQRIKRLLRARFGTQSLISVVETHCTDPDCPGPATQITILGFDMVRRCVVLHRPVAEVTEADLAAIRM